MDSAINKNLQQTNSSEVLFLKILIIEDNPGDVVIIRELLKASTYPINFTNVSTLKDSISFLSSSKFDVILLDLGLPDSTGLETLRALLQSELSPPVVVMTGLDDENIALEALRVGAQDYIVKNQLNSENILRSIKYSIERKKLQNLQKKNSHQLSILSETTAALFEGDQISSVNLLICSSIRKLIAGSFTMVIEFDSNSTFHLSDTEQFKPLSENFKSLTGLDLKNYTFRLADQNQELVHFFKDGQVHLIERGMNGLLGSRYDSERSADIERILGIKNTYVIGFLKNEVLYGGILIFLREEMDNDDRQIIENLCSQASLSIYRRIIKRNLILSEAKYQKLAEDLEEKVQKRTLELEKANKQLRKSETQLKELNATKDKFFNIVAHDLKNPFTSLLGATELLFQNIQNMDKEKISRLAQILNDSAKSGYAILLNLLDWSRSQTGMIKINSQKINLKKLLDENLADLHLNCLDKQITMLSELTEDIHIISDRNMLNTVLRNLLSNAIKFTHRGGKVLVSAKVENDQITVCVKDNGIGISSENIGNLFRIDSKYSRPGTEKELGTGLGLKLCKEFIEKLEGKIWVVSIENKGSNFCFSIPLLIEEKPSGK